RIGTARPAAAQQGGARGGTMTIVTSMASAGPCEATVPTREAASPRRVERVEVRALTTRDVLTPAPDGEARPARVVVRKPVGWLGVNTVDVSDLRVTAEGRVVRYCSYPVVVSVEPGSPAEKGGLTSGDTIVAYAGRDLLKSGEIALDRLFVPGQRLRVTVRRDGRTVEKPITIEQRPTYAFFRSVPLGTQVIVRSGDGRFEMEQRRGAYVEALEPGTAPRPRAPRPPREFQVTTATAPAAPGAPATPVAIGDAPPAPLPAMPPLPVVIGFGASSVVLGAKVVAADNDLREELRAAAERGLVVRVLPGTASAAAGLRGGDVIVRAGGQPVLTPAALHRVVQRYADERALPLRVDRAGHEKDVTVRW
ncbi:PDZ domain-containing protein, partial [Roseisolibacter sp. H3M3-2]|uniref:PDZ domain-containing protein n=1 Tax=Roseisolibacter sp. H3M3-2 TaxID=3031323 RepID=UPI0023DBC9E4